MDDFERLPLIEAYVADSPYQWGLVLIVTGALISLLLPAAYRQGFPRRAPLQQMAFGSALIVVGMLLSQVFGDSLLDAVLLRARYAWCFVFGYPIVIANAIVLVVGIVMVKLGRVPPWIPKDSNAPKE